MGFPESWGRRLRIEISWKSYSSTLLEPGTPGESMPDPERAHAQRVTIVGGCRHVVVSGALDISRGVIARKENEVFP